MTGTQIRQSFLDFFKEKQHTIVPSSSLMPDAPNLLFTNSGMNQFVPIFLGRTRCPYNPARAADTQKSIRAGGKHNDLEDVGFDTYHHTFFEMLGNWSFGDYFKKEAIEWAWELVVARWKFPANRVYATVYKPGPGDPAQFDQEAYDLWSDVFKKAGLDPKIHIVYGNKKDNFWMMGETGPCGPCSELHIDLTPEGDTKGSLVNKGDARCIEIWNLVFIQFNATPDGRFEPLPARHVDTGMGFERVASIIQGTKNFTDFHNARISNYETDIFRPLFNELEKLSGKKYGSTLPSAGGQPANEQEKIDVAFRVIADHVRTLSFAIADGIIPGNTDRNYVLRRILRRAVRYGRELGLHEPFLAKLVPVLVSTMSEVFPEIRTQKAEVQRVLTGEEESFLRTLDRGIELFNKAAEGVKSGKTISGMDAFKLYDTYGFPLDLTQLMARERGFSVDEVQFNKLMDEQRERSMAAQKKEVISVVDTESVNAPATEFVGYDKLEVEAKVLAVVGEFLITDKSPFYTAMGGQVGDEGLAGSITVTEVTKDRHNRILHRIKSAAQLKANDNIKLSINPSRRSRVESHHSATHIMHWALRRVLGTHVSQKGSYVGPDRLRFDFSHNEQVNPEQLNEINRLVNQHIDAAEPVKWENRPYAQVKGDPSILQFFGDKYGDEVRVVSIGDYSKELCGGTHVTNTKHIGFFHIVSEGAIAAGVRRIEAICGDALAEYVREEFNKQNERHELLKKKHPAVAALLPAQGVSARDLWDAWQKRHEQLEQLDAEVRELEKKSAKELESRWKSQAAAQSADLISGAKNKNGVPVLAVNIGSEPAGYLPILAEAIKSRWKGVLVLAAAFEGKVGLLASVSPDFTGKVQAGKIIQTIAPIIGGNGGGRPDLAQGGGTQPEKIAEALAKVESLLP
jgi:alanyl-tRNA synthetase